MDPITVSQTQGAPITFMGELVTAIEAAPVGTRQSENQHVISLYRTDSGTWVALVTYKTTYAGDAPQSRAIVGATPEQLLGAFAAYDPAHDKQGWPEGAQFTQKRLHVEARIRRNFREAVNRLTGALPGMAARLPFQSWSCDVCGQSIQDPTSGRIEWVVPEAGGVGHGLRIVHRDSCTYDKDEEALLDEGKVIGDIELQSGLGPDGLMLLLGLLDDLPPAEVVECIRRCQVPLYEEARRHLSQAEREGLFSFDRPPGAHTQDELLRVLQRYGPMK